MWLEDVKGTTPFRFSIAVSKPHAFFAVGATVTVIIAAAAEALSPYAFKRIVDLLTEGEGSVMEGIFMWALVYLALVGVVSPFMYRLSGFLGMRWSVGLRATVTHVLSSYVTRHSTEYFTRRFAGAIGSKIGNAAQGVKGLAEGFLWTHLIFFVSLIATLWLVFHTYAPLGFLFVVWLLIATPLNIYLAQRKMPLSVEAQAQETKTRARVIDMLTNIFTVHDFARRAFEMEELKSYIRRRYDAGIRNWTFSEVSRIINNVLELFFVGGFIFGALYLWGQGDMTAGDVVLILTLINAIKNEVSHIGRSLNDFSERYGEVKEGLEEIYVPHEVVDVPYATPLVPLRGEVEFINVSFAYLSEPILSDLSFRVAPGEKVGIVGKSGAGKSTLTKILLRQYDLTGGKILIDGQDIGISTKESVRNAIAIIPQEPMLFHRSILENIRYGNLGVGREEVIEAAKLAQAHEFIEKTPQGYDTLVGERGVKLSGGQRQRVAIARALLRDAKILILDEATSSLDSENEALIQQALLALIKDKTVIAIAHRLSTLRAMDRIVVLDEGKIVEEGTHERLLAQGGIYAELWAHQAGGFLQDK